MTLEEHRIIHVKLHRALDQLLADYMAHHPDHKGSYLDIPLRQFTNWSHQQTIMPTEIPSG